MQFKQELTQTQRLVLTQAMRQSLKVLQMPAMELREYLQEQTLSNPLLELDEAPAAPSLSDIQPPRRQAEQDLRWDREWSGDVSADRERPDFTAFSSRPEQFSEYLEKQIGQMRLLDAETRGRCLYLIGCLNSSGYLDCPLSELAGELRCTLFEAEQALYVVQALDPPGVGARNLSECLMLQLMHSHEFTEINIRLIKEQLPLLAKGSVDQLAQALHCPRDDARRAAEVVRGLNPIPSRGFCSETTVPYALPEADIRVEDRQVVVELYDRLLPKVTLTPEYCAMLDKPDFQDAQLYLREKINEARSLLSSLKGRNETLVKLLSAIAGRQSGALLSGAPLSPMTMQSVAEELGLNVSTVSRAVQEKYIRFGGRTVALRSLFTGSLPTQDGAAVSPDGIKRQIRAFIAAEDPARPLSDDALCDALTNVGIRISRRTVAKYRAELGIPSKRERKK